MKVAIHYKETEKWKNYTKLRNISITKTSVILIKMDGDIEVIDRDKVKYIRGTKLYEM